MTSSTLYYWLGRWGLVVAAFGIGWGGAFAAYEGDLGGAAVSTTSFVVLLGVALWVHDRIAVVTLVEEGVKVRGGGGVEHYRWGDIASVSQVRQAAPPVYRVSFRGERDPAFCVVAEAYFLFEVLGFVASRDLTNFGAYARTQILRASIEAEKARISG